MKNLIVYESKYGTTKECAYILSKVIGYSRVITPKEFKSEYSTFDNYIILSPIYNEKITDNIYNFISENKELLSKNNVYCIIVDLSDRAELYLKSVKDILKDSLIMVKSINGNLIIDKLDKDDYEAIKKFSAITSTKLEDNIKFNIDEVIKVALDIKAKIDSRVPQLDENIVKDVVTKFISKHNTAVLCTSYGNFPRATPIEYIYSDGFLYFISEGGVKFANILRNNNVSIGIFDKYEDMKKLRGIQITGKAFLIDYLSDEYFEVMKLKRISKNVIEKLDVMLNVFKVSIEKVEVLNTDFKKYGGNFKQILGR